MSGRASGRSDLHGSSPQIHLIGDHASSPTLKRSSTDAKLRNSPDNTGRPQSGLGLPRSGSTVIAGQPSQKPRTLRESALAGGGSKEFSRKGTNGSLQCEYVLAEAAVAPLIRKHKRRARSEAISSTAFG
eukprot:Opistho-2@67648